MRGPFPVLEDERKQWQNIATEIVQRDVQHGAKLLEEFLYGLALFLVLRLLPHQY